MTSDQIRSAFLAYFETRDHRVVKSSPLVPQNDPTLLFANAGMNQFKDVFLGREKRDYSRAASSQKCVRAGGKHNDLENVGVTARHHTFFEMLGNFSFGDYFKKEAIAYAWEFLTEELGLPPERLLVTVFAGEDGIPRDGDAHRFWTAHVAEDRILELGMKDNFWAMGETGPSGPCSEVHYLQGDAVPCPQEAGGGSCAGVECECDRWIEVWNLVFMQYDRDDGGRYNPLPAPCVDTGMGLERVAAVVQKKTSNYDTDLFTPLLAAVAQRAGRPYGAAPDSDVSMRVVADHLRATTFLVSDGVLPGNEGRGYVLRKIMRRAMRHGKKLGIEGLFLADLTGVVVQRMKAAYPELVSHAETVRRVVGVEEDRFGTTLRQAVAIFEDVAGKIPPGGVVPGEEAFRLYDTYGLPLDFTEELAADRGFAVDAEGFQAELQAQQERARQASRMGVVKGDPVYMELLEERGATVFLGYDTLAVEDARVVAVLRDGTLVRGLDAGTEGVVLLDRTPFYAQAGGQVGDRGILASDGSAAEVTDTTSPVPGLTAHHVRVTDGGLETGRIVRAEVDARRRWGAMRHHTATHLLHAALRDTLGPHVKQEGSLVAPERLRFDFSHFAPLSPGELRHIENRVNAAILDDKAVEKKEMARDEALAYGALAFFGDKYGERVRVVEVPGVSKEFCGGTHVDQTGQIGLFLFTEEQGISAGTRRVEAITGEAALRRAQTDQGILEELERSARVGRDRLVDEYARLREQLKARERELQALKVKLATAAAPSSVTDQVEVGGTLVWTPRFDGLDRKAHAEVVDEFRNRHRDRPFALLSAAVVDGGVHVIAALSPALASEMRAGEIMKRLGLKGGGRPEYAQGGGVAPADVDELRGRASTTLREMLEAVKSA
jgi:alanyl-tRNA synthetase